MIKDRIGRPDRAERACDELTPQEREIATTVTAEYFEDPAIGPRLVSREMARIELWSAICEALRQRKFAHLRKAPEVV